MSVDAAFEANAQLAKGGKPSMGAFDDPTVTPEAIVALNAFASDAAFDAPAPEMLPATADVIGLVCMHFPTCSMTYDNSVASQAGVDGVPKRTHQLRR